jgi:sugar lactone lactonase YvrE
VNLLAHRRSLRMTAATGAAAVLSASLAVAVAVALPAPRAFVNRLKTTSLIASAVPATGLGAGDVNPYGTAVVPKTVGDLHRGDVLVSNFNNQANQQGTGSTIMEVSPSGRVGVFARVAPPSPGGVVGLTTALVVLRSGFVIVGNLPAAGGMSANAQAGGLTVLDARGKVLERITGAPINGPWDATALDAGHSAVLFVANVLNGTVAAAGGNVERGTVVRITLRIPSGGMPRTTSERVIATGFREHTDPNALVVGPTGVGLGTNGILYVADTARNRIAAVPDALTRTTTLTGGGRTVSIGHDLMSPLGLMIAPNRDIVTANGGDGNLVETTPAGRQLATKTLVPDGAGDLFGLALAPSGHGIYYVNDAGSGADANSLELLH